MAYNTITLFGKQTCDYLYIQNSAIDPEEDFSYVDDEPSEWSEDTLLYANFNDPERRLAAGDSAVIGDINGYKVYRRKYNESNAEYVCTISSNEGGNINDYIVDYSVKNGIDYIYYLFPSTETTEGGTPISPLMTKPISINVPYWSLFIVDETEEENVFYIDKLFKFELNLQVDDMSNNAQVSITQNFTKYPTVQYGASNYWTGSLSSLCGFISCGDLGYIQNVNMINELKSITSDTRRKFLKDTSGNLWEVNVAAPINISTENMIVQDIKTLKFSWVEVGDAKGVSIINNPTKAAISWILTETGAVIPYYTYQWGEQYIWDNSYFWTANENRSNQNTNLGRNMTEQAVSENNE